MSEKVVQLSDANFDDQVINNPGLWLVDFWAEWCGPCHALGPILEDLAEQTPTVRVGKLDVSDFEAVGERFDVQSLPTMIIFQNGEPVTRLFGVKNLRQLQSALRKIDASFVPLA